ncbi:hypothetical protein EFK03_18375 [Escherichia coli]|nr:hypothetical protein [Escherichia coli]
MSCLLIALPDCFNEKNHISCHEQCLFILAMIVITIILYGYKTIGAASYPLSINDAKHPLTILKGNNTTDEKMTNLFAG